MGMIIRPVFKTSRNHPDALLFDRSIIEMDGSSNHSMVFVREIGIVPGASGTERPVQAA